ncbi:tetratricopeptide repeat protein, partial [uncultured Phenylobacterium sp.]|uniref:tetratricopeptide repeat protein n=1 Tax=uncultured Phenylobacterium sp. TaxID=349273 RepID=UPI0025FDFA6A
MRKSLIAFAIAASAISSTPAFAQPAGLDGRIDALARTWDHANYETQGQAKVSQLAAIVAQADALARQYPGRAEPLIWKGIALSTEAGAKGGMGALGLAKEAKANLEQAEKIDPKALNGSVYTSLGSLYYQVPGFPVGFGDKSKARAYLKRALAANPNGVDSNYFYADFMFHEGQYGEAERALQKALNAPARPGREVADRGRHAEAVALLAKVRAK